ncbi:MAG TPA: glycosyltransferase family 4 protein [Bryobacteraceae bacterium]|jgi:glycosyltransferase involved in cell wall biosynthesis
MNRFSILLISDTYPPVVGGSEVEAQRVCGELIRRGHRAQVLTAGGPPMPPVAEWVDPENVPVRILTRTARGRIKDLQFAAGVAWTLWRQRRNYQIVYFLMQGLHLAAALPVARALGKPIVMKFGGSGVIPMMRGVRMGRVELRWLRKWAFRLMVLNDGMMQEAIDDGFPRHQMLWMPNPVNIDEFRPGSRPEIAELRAKYGIPSSALVAIYTGRLSQEKGLPPLLRGFAAAARTEPNALLLLVGDGAQRPELERLAVDLGLGPKQIRFVGRVTSGEVALWLRASDIFALISPSEGFSCALLEAMSTGLASVVTNIPANQQLVDDSVHGMSVPVADDAAVGRAFKSLFQDAEARKRMGAAARQRIVENYSTGKVAERYEALFSEMLKAPGSLTAE